VIVGPANGQHGHRPGISSILKVSVQQHVGYAVTFFANATAEQRSQVKADMRASPAVLKVFENIAPQDIESDQLVSSEP